MMSSGRSNVIRKAKKGRSAMQSSPQTASTSLPVQDSRMDRSSQQTDYVYQIGTVAAMLMLLVTLWVF